MTALDRAFIRAYGRPRSGYVAKPANRAAAPSTVAFERGPALHRIDPAEGEARIATQQAGCGQQHAAPSVATVALPSVEELFSHAVGIADVVDLAPASSAQAIALAKESVAATAADLRQAWPARFATDSRTLFDPQLDAQVASAVRPLSAFAPVAQVAEPVRPLLEVDRFEWSSQCHALCASSPVALDQFVSRLLPGAAKESHRVALIGLDATAGRTTVAMCLARRAAAKGENWVLVDADFEKPELAGRLGIVGQTGWPRVIAGERELGEVMIASLDDRLAIVPLEAGTAVAERLRGNPRAAEMFDMLADAYDLVLFDAGSRGPGGVERLASLNRTAHWSAAYLVYDARTTAAGDVAAYARQLTAAGLHVAGAIENFAPPPGDAATL